MLSAPTSLIAIALLLGQADADQARAGEALVDEVARRSAEAFAALLDSSNPWARQRALQLLSGLPDQSVPRAVELLDETEQLSSPRCVELMSRKGVILADGLRYARAECEIARADADLSNGALARKLLSQRTDGVLAKALVARTAQHPASVERLLPLVRPVCGYLYQELAPALEAASEVETQAALLRLALPGSACARILDDRLAARLRTLAASADARVSRRAALLLSLSQAKDAAALRESLCAQLRDPARSGLSSDLAQLDSAAPFAHPLAARLALQPIDLDDTLDAVTSLRADGASATPALIALLGRDGGRHDERVDKAIAAIGPKARSAVPALVKQISVHDWLVPASLQALDAIQASLDEAQWKPIARVWRSRCSLRSIGPHDLHKPDCDQSDAAINAIARRSNQRVPRERSE